MKAWLLSLLLGTPVLASDGVTSNGILTDQDFLHLTTCGAIPGGACQMDPVRWPDPANLTIGFGPVPKGYPVRNAYAINAALDHAVSTVNAVGSGVRLRRIAHTDSPDIALRPTMFFENDAVYGEPGVSEGEIIGAGYVYVWWNAADTLTSGTILIAQDVLPDDIASIVLEEVTQSLGFLYDIENPAYEGVSIFAQDSNAVLSLTGQDATILRLYYPN